MRLEPLYRVRFTYPEDWMIELEGDWQLHLFMAEGSCAGSIVDGQAIGPLTANR